MRFGTCGFNFANYLEASSVAATFVDAAEKFFSFTIEYIDLVARLKPQDFVQMTRFVGNESYKVLLVIESGWWCVESATSHCCSRTGIPACLSYKKGTDENVCPTRSKPSIRRHS